MNQLSKTSFLVALIGLTFSWVFFPPVLMSGYFSSLSIYTFANEAILAFCVVLFLLAVILRRRLERFIKRHPSFMLCIIFTSLIGYALLVVQLATGLNEAITLISTFLLSLGYVSLMVCWMLLLGLVGSKQITLLLFGSALGYAALTLGNFLPLEGRMLLCGSSTSISGICWLLSWKKVKTFQTVKPFSYDLAVLRHGPYLMLGILSVLLIGARIVTGLYFSLENDLSLSEMLIRCISIAAVMVFCIFEAKREVSLEQEYRSAWIPAAVLFLLGAMIIIGMTGSAERAGLGITHGTINCFEVLGYLIMFQFIKNDRVSPIMVVSLGMIVFKVLPIFLQRIVFPRMTAALGLTSVDFVPVVILMSMAVVVCALAFGNHRATTDELHTLSHPGINNDGEQGEIAPESEANKAAEKATTPPDSPDEKPALSFEEACLRLAEEGSLSTRETEIMLLIARGNSQKYISEVLYLALGTVQWYAKTIYRKLDVHSKQELINRVHDQMIHSELSQRHLRG